MDVQVELVDGFGNPTTQFSTSEPLNVQVTLQNLGDTPEVQWYASSCLYQHFLWDAAGQYTIAPPRQCLTLFQQLVFSCGDPPVFESDNLVAYETDFSGFPTTTPLVPGLYDLDVDTYYYGVFSFVVEVVP